MEVTKVVNEGFVFLVNKENSIESLTMDQIKDIYSGKITNWKSLGGNDTLIKAYQRPVNSGSQTGMISLVMKDIKLKNPEMDEVIEDMAGLIEWVANFTGDAPGIGYSYYYYANAMYVNENIKLLGINGIKPSFETIQNETYPIMTAYYIVTRKNDSNANIKKLKEAMLSNRGKEVAKDAGYIPVK